MTKKKETIVNSPNRAEIENQILKEMIQKLMQGQPVIAPGPVTAPISFPPALTQKEVEASTNNATKRDWSKVKHTCPKCGRTGAVSEYFGTRLVRGVEQKQSYCSSCRGKTQTGDGFKRKRPYKPRAAR